MLRLVIHQPIGHSGSTVCAVNTLSQDHNMTGYHPTDVSDVMGDESSVGTGAYMTCLWSANQLGLAYVDQTTGCVRVSRLYKRPTIVVQLVSLLRR